MSDETFGDHSFSELGGGGGVKRGPSPELNAKADALLTRRADYVNLAEAFRDFWMRVDVMGPAERDRWVEVLYAQYLMLAPHLGVSLTGLPQLRECCGQERKRAGLLGDPAKTLYGTAPTYAASPVEELAWWPGDIIRRITRFFGRAYCEKCDQRRRWINEMFGKRY